MNEFRADLHCHSTFSDGSDTPFELLQKAHEAGLQGLSITDHDTIAAYSPELFTRAEELNIALLPGVEISSELDGEPIHILGYGFSLDSPSLQPFLVEMQQRRAVRNRAILAKLTEKGMPITEQELLDFAAQSEKRKTIGRPHIAALMMQKGYVASFQEAFERYIKERAPCYVPGFKRTPAEVIEEIHKADGKAVLAHPYFLKRGSFLQKVLAHSFDGIECHYGNLSKEQEAPWKQIAKERNWLMSGGSDYHGSFKPYLSLGCSWVGRETFNAFSVRSRGT